ncbi:hypothetical protein [Formosa sp. PL04]|uniref:hypothetical protein n=1 Tax=Formosa sp. PL04 TaxID=3081755 RepID=UPI002981AADB|nr:hypothetical protein [Formosa sp. PL04]MDW5288006.1 hypothetical protein [Formosa sp. PL04]
MKQILILLVAVICFSCNSDDDGNVNYSFNPPSWIQGSWYTAELSIEGVKFTSDDFCTITNANQTCYKALIAQADDTITVDNQQSTDNDYTFVVVYLGEPGVEKDKYFYFRKLSETQIASVGEDGETLDIYTKH